MSHLRIAILVPLLSMLAGCGASVGGGDASGEFTDTVSEDTALFAILDLESGGLSWHTELPGGEADPALRTSKMAFRRVVAGGQHAMVGIFEVTQRQWQLVHGAPAPATWPWEDVPDAICASSTAHGDDRPAYNVDHQLVSAALDGFTITGGGRLALPTDAQWTAACGTATGWAWGDTTSQAQLAGGAVVRETVITPARLTAGGIDAGGPLPVGSRAANARGFYDMHGNVWELIAGGDHARGGSWRDGAWQSRSDSVMGSGQGFDAGFDHALVGFRMVLIP